MAVEATRVCDWLVRKKRCGRPCTEQFKGVLDSVGLKSDLCDEHTADLKDLLESKGITVHAIVDSKPRAAHQAKSGEIFSTAQARKWLHDQGLLDRSNGRVSQELLDMYAAAH